MLCLMLANPKMWDRGCRVELVIYFCILDIVQGEKGSQILVVPELADYIISSLEKVAATF